MASWFDDIGFYDWSDPRARDLHKRLTQTFYDSKDAENLVQRAGSPQWEEVKWNDSPSLVWISILSQAGREGTVSDLLRYILAETKVAKSLRDFLKNLLEDKPVVVDPEPVGPEGPDFDSSLTKAEALLFRDDLSEPIGEVMLLINAIRCVMASSDAVCRVLVTAADGTQWNGTGVLLTGERVLTNHHVLFPNGQPCIAVTLEFERNAAKGKRVTTPAQGNVASIRGDAADDWAVIGLKPPAGARALDLSTQVSTPVEHERAYIIQHPEGQSKRLAFVRNRIASISNRRVYYLTDTRGGSSGSPVFDGKGALIALHRAGGVPQRDLGAEPVVKNEGVRLDMVRAAIGP